MAIVSKENNYNRKKKQLELIIEKEKSLRSKKRVKKNEIKKSNKKNI